MSSAGKTAWVGDIPFGGTAAPWLAMGTGRIDEADWLVLPGPDDPDDPDDLDELAERSRLVAERSADVCWLPAGSEDAGVEVLELVLGHLAAHGRGGGQGRPTVDPDAHPLVAAARLVREDLVVMAARDGAHHLDAAVLCAPSHWRLADKVGGSTATIHGPVPGYADELADRVDRFLERLRPGVIVARRNWTVHEDDARFAPVARPPARGLEVGAAPGHLWLRSERQTLRRLPRTGGVLFTILVQQAPLGVLADHPAQAAALAARLRAQPDDLTRMNGLAPHRDAVLAWLGGLVN